MMAVTLELWTLSAVFFCSVERAWESGFFRSLLVPLLMSLIARTSSFERSRPRKHASQPSL